jgi:hypothetical protein
MRRRLAGDQGMRMGESHSYPAAIGRPDRDDLIVAIGLVRSTADGQTNTIARARFVESRISPMAPMSTADDCWNVARVVQ